MNKLNFIQTGGFPLKAERLNELQNAFAIFNAFGALSGENTIISGCEVNGNSTKPGIVFHNGELFEFVGGLTTDKVRVSQEATSRQFYNGETKDVHYRRYMEFGSGPDAINWDSFSKVNPILELQKAMVPKDLISMWSGSVNNIPQGWALCDGSGGTPDLRGKFIVGYNPADSDYNAIGKTGGEKKHTLTEAEMPAHNHAGTISPGGGHSHAYRDAYHAERENNRPTHPRGSVEAIGTTVYGSGDSDTDNRYLYYLNRTTGSAGSHSHSLNIKSKGGGQAHENRPPYYTLAYIIFKG